ncbi:MAG TPA: AraC family transcriptional regulator [Longimicrobiales bacterium]|nr:AraC family transcriptional regulator [Longimicrobiales bacterium]
MPRLSAEAPGLQLFRPPYDSCTPIDPGTAPAPFEPGVAAVWFMSPDRDVLAELQWAAIRPRSVPLIVVLPEPEEAAAMLDALRAVPSLKPKDVLPGVGRGMMRALRTLLAAPPATLHTAAADYLEDIGAITPESRERVETIFANAPNTSSIEALARHLCQSRRTLGRYFHDRDLPVPSHWLQFARSLHVAIQLQNTRQNIGRVAARFGYPDGFTMSNAMKRLTGFRPSFVRKHLGWEWLVEAWWRRERGS